jgi:outer membrane protein OmpA-like peptidoglycan-associated protein
LRYCTFILLLITSTAFTQTRVSEFSIYFKHDLYELSEEHRIIIDSIKRMPNKNDLDVHIKGYTNSYGTDNYNLELSRNRAEKVKSELREFTIISSIGYGEIKSTNAINRRVDILVHRKVNHLKVVGEIIEAPYVEGKPLSLQDLLDPKVGDKVTLKGIMFYPDRDAFMNESKPVLELLVNFLTANPTIRFKLIGHVCCGDPQNPWKDAKNLRTGKRNLSEARAQALHNYLVKKGIDKKRIRYHGMAFKQPTKRGDQFDRRVEIEITYMEN